MNENVWTNCRWTRAFQQSPTVPLHHWWWVDEQLYVVIDNVVQHRPTSCYDSPLCSSRSLMECVWNRQDTLYSTMSLYIDTTTRRSQLDNHGSRIRESKTRTGVIGLSILAALYNLLAGNPPTACYSYLCPVPTLPSRPLTSSPNFHDRIYLVA